MACFEVIRFALGFGADGEASVFITFRYKRIDDLFSNGENEVCGHSSLVASGAGVLVVFSGQFDSEQS